MKTFSIIFMCLYLFITDTQAQETLTDIDGNVYSIVTIGDQTWMGENLKTTRYNNGVIIENIEDSTTWADTNSGAYCYYDNDSVSYFDTYGSLYNWHSVNDDNGLCPTGWHVSSDAEWDELIDFLGDSSVAGGKLKEAGTEHWNPPNIGATNESGFTALPGGLRYATGFNDLSGFAFLQTDGLWWSSDEAEPGYAWGLYLGTNYEYTQKAYGSMNDGFSVRCICDSMINDVNDAYDNIKIHIFPNPTKDIIKITEAKDAFAIVYDMTGREIRSFKIASDNKIISVSDLKSGVYYLKFAIDKRSVTKKIIIHN
jgi:uncharacterized protein (TIGR02145 family)